METANPHPIFSQDYANNYEDADIEAIFHKEKFKIDLSDADIADIKAALIKSHDYNINSTKDYTRFIAKELHSRFPKTELIHVYRKLLQTGEISKNTQLERFMKFKGTRGNSGVVVMTIFTSGVQFGDKQDIKRGGCPENCFYCPFEKDDKGVPTQPRSYLSTEPGNMRATQNKHHPLGQIFDRANTLEAMGHISSLDDVSSKVEIIISGGTINFYPDDYLVWFTTCTYYALNVYYDYKQTGKLREMFSLEEEQFINETASLRMIGLTVETRPDKLVGPDDDKFKVIRFFRRLGVTRCQIGVQTTDDDTLAYVNRNCTNAKNKEGIRILKQNGFKTDIHLMLDLPMPPKTLTNIPEEHLLVIQKLEQELGKPIPEEFINHALRDLAMIDEVISDPDYQVDQWKVYPTMITPYTKILEWYENGDYKPYGEFENGKLLERVIIYLKERVPNYIRLNRIIRDIPTESIYGGISCPDMRNNIMIQMKKENITCHCIRCREVKNVSYNESDIMLFTEEYENCGGTEYFISYENANRTKLFGMIRLRLNNKDNDMRMPELRPYALIRELHVYGSHSAIGNETQKTQTQHKGLGKRLIKEAEEIAYKNGYDHVCVISGVGVREYYRKLGFTDHYTYLIKHVDIEMWEGILPLLIMLFLVALIANYVKNSLSGNIIHDIHDVMDYY